MPTVQEMLRARLAANKKESENVTIDVDAKPVVPATVASPVQERTAEPVGAEPVRPGNAAAQEAVVVGAGLQSAVAVVLPPAGAPVDGNVSSSVTSGELAGTDDEAAGTDLDTANPVHFQFLERLSQLTNALLARDPLMKSHLKAIHMAMIENEELPNLLRPHEIAKIMAAQQAHTNVVLAVATAKKEKKASSKRVAQLGLDDV